MLRYSLGVGVVLGLPATTRGEPRVHCQVPLVGAVVLGLPATTRGEPRVHCQILASLEKGSNQLMVTLDMYTGQSVPIPCRLFILNQIAL